MCDVAGQVDPAFVVCTDKPEATSVRARSSAPSRREALADIFTADAVALLKMICVEPGCTMRRACVILALLPISISDAIENIHHISQRPCRFRGAVAVSRRNKQSYSSDL